MKVKLFLMIAILAGGFYFFWQNRQNLPGLAEVATNLEEIKKTVSAPGPLRLEFDSPRSFLTVLGVVSRTNLERSENGLPPLSPNTKLNTVASVKANDMFARGYFAHVAPDGREASHLVEQASYQFITIGENLALGNYEDDEALVQAWMASPGHRENILNKSYREIGVAVRKDIFEGKATWLAVQIFGKPSSACPGPDAALKTVFSQTQKLIEELKVAIEQKRQELEAEQRGGHEYNEKVRQHNALVAEHNRLVEETKLLVGQYNAQVAAFNVCARQ